MWPFKKWNSVTKWVDKGFQKYNDNINAKYVADKAIAIRQQAIAAITNRPYNTVVNIEDSVVDIEQELTQLLKFVATKKIVAVNYPVVSRRYKLRGRVFMVCVEPSAALHIYGISLSDKLGDKINGTFMPNTINGLGKTGRRYCKHIDDTPYWRAAVKLNIYRLMMLKSGAKVENLTLIALNAAYDNFQLIEIPIIDALNRVAYKL